MDTKWWAPEKWDALENINMLSRKSRNSPNLNGVLCRRSRVVWGCRHVGTDQNTDINELPFWRLRNWSCSPELDPVLRQLSVERRVRTSADKHDNALCLDALLGKLEVIFPFLLRLPCLHRLWYHWHSLEQDNRRVSAEVLGTEREQEAVHSLRNWDLRLTEFENAIRLQLHVKSNFGMQWANGDFPCWLIYCQNFKFLA